MRGIFGLSARRSYKQGGYEVEVSPFSEKAPEVLLNEVKTHFMNTNGL